MVNPLSSPIYLIPPLVAVAISVALAVLILHKAHKSFANRLFCLVLLSLGLLAIFTFLMRASPDVEHALFWERLMLPAGFAMFVFYYHFLSVYTRANNRKLLWAAYSLLVVACILSSAGLVASHMTLESYGYAPHFLPTIYIFPAGGCFFLVMGLVNLIRALGGATRYEERSRLTYMIIAIAFPFSFALLDLIPGLPPLAIYGHIVFGLLTAIAILRYHLLDINVAMRKGLAYLLTSAAVASLYIGLLTLLNHILGATNVPIWGHVVLLVLLAFGLHPLWRRVQRLVDRWFYRQRYDFLKELERFSQETHDITNIEQLGSSLVKLTSQALQTSGIHLLLVSKSGDFTVIASAGENAAQLTLRRHNPILRWLQSNSGLLYYQDLDIIPRLQSLTARERSELEAIGVELLVPLKTKKDELVGVLLLGRKLSQQPYSHEDERLVSTVASRITIEVENARLYRDALRARENLEAWLNTMNDCVIIVGTDYTIQFMNKAAAQRFDSSTGGKCWSILGKEVQCSKCPARQHPREHEDVSHYGISIGGRDYDIIAAPLLSPDGSVSIIEVLRDTTERKRIETALRESEEKLRLMFESVTQGIMLSDLNANIVQVNEAMLRMHGYDGKDGLIGRSVFEFIAEKDHARAMENLKRTLEEGYVKTSEYTLLRKDGSEFDAELSTAVTRDASGNPVGFVAITDDVTERKRAQEREKQLQEQLNLSSRLASVGELAAGVAHEVNNPLTGILGFSQRLLRKCTDEKVSQDLEKIYGEAMRAAKVVRNLLIFARHREPKKQYSDINDIVQNTLELRAYELKTSNIEVVTELAPGLPKIMVDFHQLQEVFLNIILNAEQVMTEVNRGGKLSINTERVKDYVQISFADNGPGIPTDKLNKVFDPFFTLRRERGGTGLGLSVSHGIVTSHGGRIYAKSRPGKGATFFIELPVTTENTDEGEVNGSSLPEQSK